MIQILIGDKKHDIPTDWKDMTLEFWCFLFFLLMLFLLVPNNLDN